MYISDGSSNYPRPRKPAWTKIKRHERCHLIPRWLHISEKIVGALIKAKLKIWDVTKTLLKPPFKRATATKESQYIYRPRESKRRDRHSTHLKLLLSSYLSFSSHIHWLYHWRLRGWHHTGDHPERIPFFFFLKLAGTWTSSRWSIWTKLLTDDFCIISLVSSVGTTISYFDLKV